jgi:demethylmenaquinone methyltransferase/2-methoxy-6-polyprenyl-1,4-benzoquinol methylase
VHGHRRSCDCGDQGTPGARIVGVDFAGAMLRVGLEKLRRRGLDRRITLVRGDATRIPVRDAWADAATIGFGIRNVAQPEAALAELARVIKPGGRLVILEFGEPVIPGIRAIYNWYFRVLLPRLGRVVSKHQSAYSYLPASVGTFLHRRRSPPPFLHMVLRASGQSP